MKAEQDLAKSAKPQKKTMTAAEERMMKIEEQNKADKIA
jgi:hypothetical protein